MRVLWSAASLRHLHEIAEYLQGENYGAATTMRRRILEAKQLIGQMPFSGRIGRVDGTREAVVPRTPYIIVYRVSDQTVEILGIWHGAQEWPESF